MVHTFSPANNHYGATVQLSSSADGVAFDSARGIMYAADGILNRIDKIGAVNRTLFGSVPGETPGWLATDTKSNYLFVGHYSSIDVLNDTTYARVEQIPDSHGFFGAAYDAKTGELWVANQDENITVYNVAANTSVATIFFNGSLVGYSPQSPYGPNVISGFRFDPQTNYMYVSAGWWDYSSDTGANQLSAINATTRTIVYNWTGAYFGGGMAVDPFHYRFYQINYDPAYGGSWVLAYDARNLSLLGAATIYNFTNNGFATGIGWAPSTRDLYVSGIYFASDLFKVDTSNMSVVATQQVGYYPNGANVYDPLTDRMWVPISAAGSIAIVYP
jgi:hypothetical protein